MAVGMQVKEAAEAAEAAKDPVDRAGSECYVEAAVVEIDDEASLMLFVA